MTVEPGPKTAENGESENAPPMSKKTAVKTSAGTETSPLLVFVRTTTSWPPTTSKLALAANEPFEPVNVIGAADAIAGILKANPKRGAKNLFVNVILLRR